MDIDFELDARKNQASHIYGTSKVFTCQIAYRTVDNECECCILRILNYAALPSRLLDLFQDQTIAFVGIGVGGDIAKIDRNYHCLDIMKGVKRVINLGQFSRRRNAIRCGVTLLEKIILLILNENLNKIPTLRCSRWSTSNLTSERILHAGLDAIKSLEVYHKIYQLQDLCLRLQPDDFEENLKVDIISPSSSINAIINRAAHATISSLATTRAPPLFTQKT